MSIKVQNPYGIQISVGLDTAAGVNTDAVHIMPYASVKLPLGSAVTQNSKVKYPRLIITNTQTQAV